MEPRLLVRELWRAHRPGVIIISVLLLLNVGLAVGLQNFLVPAVDAREQLLIRRQAEMRSGSGSEAPALIYAQGEKDLAEFNKMIPPYREFTGLVNELYDMAADAGLDLTQISYDRKEEKDALLRYTLAFNLDGTYADIKKFVHLVEQSPRLMLIEQISLRGGGRDEVSEVRLQLNVTTFFRAGQR